MVGIAYLNRGEYNIKIIIIYTMIGHLIEYAPPPLVQIYVTFKFNNEVYNLKDMILQPYKDDLDKDMDKEVDSMFKEIHGGLSLRLK